METTTFIKRKSRSFLIGFSHFPKPEGYEEMDQLEQARHVMPMMFGPMMVSFLIETDDDKQPSHNQIYALVRDTYAKSEHIPPLEQSYGLFLDALKKDLEHPIKTEDELPFGLQAILPPELQGEFKKLQEAMPTVFKEVIGARGLGKVFVMDNFVVCIKTQVYLPFKFVKPE